jgi:hypothetical protein
MMKLSILSLVAGIACIGGAQTLAQPAQFTDLGEHLGPELFSVPVQLQDSNDIQWFRIVLPAVSADGGYVDIRSEYPHAPLRYAAPYGWLGRPDMLVFSSQGGYLNRSDPGAGLLNQIVVSWGDTDPRTPLCVYYDDEFDPHYECGHPFDGFSGDLEGGEYWLAVGQFVLYPLPLTVPWSAHSDRPAGANPERLTTLIFTIQPAGVPYCDPDMNWDGNADAGDIDYLINVIAGGENPTGRNPDFNRDGNSDMGDVDALINVIAGSGCP